ncbi:MAG TPA: MarR family transcriptional regulator [Gemmatimonadaceae bacterium]|nr:MarR family transcriptional regulator [Gemmatimonadaceae bacterium]
MERDVLADRLHSLAIHLLRRIRRGDDESGLSAPRLSALSVIIYRGPISLTELAKAEGVTAPTMTRLAQALVRAGLVEKNVLQTDNRVTLLRATASGRKTLDVARRHRLAALEDLLSRLDVDQAALVARAVDALEPLFRS